MFHQEKEEQRQNSCHKDSRNYWREESPICNHYSFHVQDILEVQIQVFFDHFLFFDQDRKDNRNAEVDHKPEDLEGSLSVVAFVHWKK